jgi:hypothetical protein
LGSDLESCGQGIISSQIAIRPVPIEPLGVVLHAPIPKSLWPPGQEPIPDPTCDLGARLAVRAHQCGLARGLELGSAPRLMSLGCSKGLLRNLGLPSPLSGYPPGPTITANLPSVLASKVFGDDEWIPMSWPAACATGLMSLIMAAQGLEASLYGGAIVGAMEFTAAPLALAGFRNMGVMSPDYCRPFDVQRRGFNTGDGGACFLLGPPLGFPPAQRGPLAWICGWDTRASSHHATAAEPMGYALEESIRRTLNRAGWTPDDVDGICAHGTGTPSNDLAEARAIARVFSAPVSSPPVFSFKGAIGHLLGASAAVELALCMVASGLRCIPGNAGLQTVDPALPELCLPLAPQRNRKLRRILKLSLGFGGPVCTIAVEMGRD